MADELTDLQAAGSYDFLFGEDAMPEDDAALDVADDGITAEAAITLDDGFAVDARDLLDPLAGEDTAPTGEPEPEPVALDAREAAKLALLAAKGDVEAAAKLQAFDPDLAFEFDPVTPDMTPRLEPGEELALQAYDEGLALWASNAWDYQQWAEQNPAKNQAFMAMQQWRDGQGLPRNAPAAVIRDHALRMQMTEQARQTAAQLDPVATWRDLRADTANTSLTQADWDAIRAAAKGKQGVQAALAMHREHAVLLERRTRAAANAPAVAKVAAAQQRAQRAQAAGQRPAPTGGAGSGSPAMTFEQLEDLFIEAGMTGRMTPQLAAQYERADRQRQSSGGSWSAV